MAKQLNERLQRIVAGMVGTGASISILLGLLVVVPLTLWFAWARHTALLNPFLVTVFCLSFGWGLVSLARCFRTLKNLGLDGPSRLRLFSGPRPDDGDEQRAWRLGWHFMYAVLAVMLCLVAIPLASWLTSK